MSAPWLPIASRIISTFHHELAARPGRTPRKAVRLRLEPLEDRRLLAAADVRSIDGTENNLAHPDWGSTNEQLLRIAAAQYGDGISSPAGADRPSARAISNALSTHVDTDTPSARDLTAYIYIWGQFIDHDLDLTGSASPSQLFSVPVPKGDPSFDPNSTGTQTIPLTRSLYDPSTGTSASNPRQQINQISAWLDGSMVYGSDSVRAAALRSFVGGKLQVLSTEVGDLPPLNSANLPIANDSHRVPNTQLFLAGDVRSNENIELTSLHTVFLREHNRLAAQIAANDRSLTDEQIYQKARAIVIAEIQVITYQEWLPALLGSGVVPAYRGYNPAVNPGIANEFSTAAFRLHSTINDDVEFFDNNGTPISFTYYDDDGSLVNVEGEVALADAFFNPTMFKQTGVDGILKYGASTHAEEMDTQLVDNLRNFLFGQPGQGGLDLASLNIQRGRDHGLADYNTERAAYGLPRVQSFAQITSNVEVQQKLKALYGNVNSIDMWVGASAEDHVRGSTLGPLMQKVVADQFARLRDGDRFWYQRAFSGRQLAQLERTTLADVIERNSDVTGLQSNVFFFKAQASGQVFVDTDRNGRLGSRESGLGGITVELINRDQEVIASTVTRRDGRYTFDQFDETGDFTVRVVVPANLKLSTVGERTFHIAAGDAKFGQLDFGLNVFRGSRPLQATALVSSDSLATPTASVSSEQNAAGANAVASGLVAQGAKQAPAVQSVASDPSGVNAAPEGDGTRPAAVRRSDAHGGHARANTDGSPTIRASKADRPQESRLHAAIDKVFASNGLADLLGA